ncbi:MAG: glycine cleavage system aminomethyltransferase GcvT [Desulfuromonadales bacterium]|nr:glycine cleavage system aminomethyltransferase GcvT [Desulfuromonadales bacterium]
MESLKQTPLYANHKKLNALMAPFGGWDMPIQYEGIIAEHKWCRENAALFDICHMGEFIFEGDIVKDGMEDIFTFSVETIPVGRSRYGFLLNESGGIIDDMIIFRIAENKVMIVVNAATADNDFSVIQGRLKGGSFRNITDSTAKLDLQGPESRNIITKIVDPSLLNLSYFKFTKVKILGEDALVSRTGYTGELGYEIFLPSKKVAELWEKLLTEPKVKPAGLGARDILRLEVGYSLYGSDLDESITPIEAGLENFVNFEKEFIGKGALLDQKKNGVSRIKIPFKTNSRRSPRHNHKIVVNGQEAGIVTSGAFSPMLGSGIGMGFIKPEFAIDGKNITITDGKLEIEASICQLPFYSDGSVRN